MPAPIKIRYYRCINSAEPTLIYPQLRDSSNPYKVVWDGRDSAEINCGIYDGT